MDLHDGTPFWPRRDGILGVHSRLVADVSCDVVVVGAGITGSLVALELTRCGLNVVVLDRRDAGGGSTSASTAMLQYEIDELLVDLGGAIGVEAAAVAYRECSRGIDLVEQATQTVGHNCGFRRSPSVFMPIRQRDVGVLRRECEARAAAGFGVQVLDGDELEDRWISSGAPPSNRSRADPSTPTPCATGHSNRQRSGMQSPSSAFGHPSRPHGDCQARCDCQRLRS